MYDSFYWTTTGLAATRPDLYQVQYTGSLPLDYNTGTHLGKKTFAFNDLTTEWRINNINLGVDDFTLEGWGRPHTIVPPFDNVGFCGLALLWNYEGTEDPAAFNVIALELGFNRNYPSNSYLYINATGVGGLSSTVDLGTAEQGWQHVCVQRIDGVEYLHHNGVPVTEFTPFGAPLPSFRPISGNAYIRVTASSFNVPGSQYGQIRLAPGKAVYGPGAFRLPVCPFTHK
jgi:hypothetical protein